MIKNDFGALHFCRMIYTAHLLLDSSLNRNRLSVVPYATEGSLQCCPNSLSHHSSKPIPNPMICPLHWGRGAGRGGFLTPWEGLSSTLNQALLFLHVKISYSFFNFQLNWCLWTFSSFPSSPCSLSHAFTACLQASIAAIVTQCGNDLLQLWDPGFVLPILIIATLIQRGHT